MSPVILCEGITGGIGAGTSGDGDCFAGDTYGRTGIDSSSSTGSLALGSSPAFRAFKILEH